MDGVTTRNMYSSLQKYNKLYIVVSCWTIIDRKYLILYIKKLMTNAAAGVWNEALKHSSYCV
jgi:hypothetical protein